MTERESEYEFTYGGRVHRCHALGDRGAMPMRSAPLERATGVMWWYVEVDGVSHRTVRAGPRDLISEAAKSTLRIRILNFLRDQGAGVPGRGSYRWGAA